MSTQGDARQPPLVVRGCAQLVTNVPAYHALPEGVGGPGERALGIVPAGAVAIEGARVAWVGPEGALPARFRQPDVRVLDARGGVVLPGLVDAHTHLVHAGSRVDEFVLRCAGASYEAIAARGGGIATTRQATRAATLDTLVAGVLARLWTSVLHGVTTIEIKSGYGLETAAELRMLEAIAAVRRQVPVTVVATFLGAHVVPPEWRHDPDGYVDLVCHEMLPEVARRGLAEFCDVFCERGAFTVSQSRRILERARDLGLGLRVHAEQLHHTGAAHLAAALGAASADHLDHVDAGDIEALAHAGTVAILLPGATLFLGQRTWPPARRLLDGGVRVALATDANPGSCPTENLPLMGSLACTQLGMRPHEALLAVTRHAAASLGREDRIGWLGPGAIAHLAWMEGSRYEDVFYHWGVRTCRGVVARGRVLVWGTGDDGPRWDGVV